MYVYWYHITWVIHGVLSPRYDTVNLWWGFRCCLFMPVTKRQFVLLTAGPPVPACAEARWAQRVLNPLGAMCTVFDETRWIAIRSASILVCVPTSQEDHSLLSSPKWNWTNSYLDTRAAQRAGQMAALSVIPIRLVPTKRPFFARPICSAALRFAPIEDEFNEIISPLQSRRSGRVKPKPSNLCLLARRFEPIHVAPTPGFARWFCPHPEQLFGNVAFPLTTHG